MSSGKPWTVQDKLDLLLQALDIMSAGRPVPVKEIKMEGRTEKSMIHTLSKLRAEGKALRESGGGRTADATTTPAKPKGRGKDPNTLEPNAALTPRRGARKRSQKATYLESTSDDDEEVKTPLKKARPSSDDEDGEKPVIVASNGKAKNGGNGIKVEEQEEDEEDDIDDGEA